MAALVVLTAIAAVFVILFGGFISLCTRIHRADKHGSLHPETLAPYRHLKLAYAARWDDNTPAPA
jgi:hypothetical protein